MEEWVGQWWHRIATRLADRSHASAAVRLDDVRSQLGVVFRALGGSPEWRLATASAQQQAGARSLLQRVAGTGLRAEQPELDAETLALPPVLAIFPDQQLNRDLYFWLAGMGAVRLQMALDDAVQGSRNALSQHLGATRSLLQSFPGWWPRYRRLVQAHLHERVAPQTRHSRQAARPAQSESILRQILVDSAQGVWPPDDVDVDLGGLAPVPMWVGVGQLAAEGMLSAETRQGHDGGGSSRDMSADRTRRRAQQARSDAERHALIMFFRTESLLSWSEFVNINRQTDDEDLADAQQVANDMDQLSVAPDGQTLASRVRFDLDLPSAAADDTVLQQGIRLPEWDHRKQALLPDRCGVQLLLPRIEQPWQPPPSLRATAHRMRRRLESLRALPRWERGHVVGERLDVDAWVRWQAECGAGGDVPLDEPRAFLRPRREDRSLATLLLADLSLSTDAWASQDARVIDVIRDALYVFGQAMDGLGDPFEMLGFSSVRREHVRVHALKRFGERWSDVSRDRVGAIKPGYYTRMGAAIRYATQVLETRTERQRLLLLLTDGKPNDLDHYEGRFGLEDTRHAVQAARRAGLVPFCITIDEQAADYLPFLFGQRGYALVHKPQDLVSRLTQIVGQLSA
ncbi:nitric oxide reductase activation protein NorD [Aquabacterium sp.]|uniref:nitric oxide reductase activation protein NorD n=1 Tax=Aquabacterium sp. TaxID=1872578 RepID=UPI0035AFFFB9